MTIDEFKRAVKGANPQLLFLLPNGYHYVPITKITITDQRIILQRDSASNKPISLNQFLTEVATLPITTPMYFQEEPGHDAEPMYGFKRLPNAIVPQ